MDYVKYKLVIENRQEGRVSVQLSVPPSLYPMTEGAHYDVEGTLFGGFRLFPSATVGRKAVFPPSGGDPMLTFGSKYFPELRTLFPSQEVVVSACRSDDGLMVGATRRSDLKPRVTGASKSKNGVTQGVLTTEDLAAIRQVKALILRGDVSLRMDGNVPSFLIMTEV